MLASDVNKLRWMGIDMSPRWRRRAAVALSYALLVGLIVSAAVWVDAEAYFKAHRWLSSLPLPLLAIPWLFLSVFHPNGLVKSFDDIPPVGFEKGYVILGSLDDWARYRYGAGSFELASEEQQKELLRIYRVGNYRVRVKQRPVGLNALDPAGLDERELAERDRTCRWALKWVATLLAYASAQAMVLGESWTPSAVSALLLLFGLMAWTLPQARVLWCEPAPSGIDPEEAEA